MRKNESCYILLAPTQITLFLKEWVDAGVIFGVVFAECVNLLRSGYDGINTPYSCLIFKGIINEAALGSMKRVFML